MRDDAVTRRRIEDLQSVAAQGQPGLTLSSAVVLVKTVVQTTYPTTANAYFYCELVDASGLPEEGQPGVFLSTGRYLTALNLGKVVPPVGTQFLAVNTSGRWTIRYEG